MKTTYKELKKMYIDLETNKSIEKDKWDRVEELYSSLAEKLLNTPELIKLYISKYELYSSSAEKLLNTPELIKLYISKYGINKTLKNIILRGVKDE